MVDTTYVIRDPVIINLIPTENAVSPTFPVSSLKLLSFFKRAHHHSKLKHHLSTPEENVSTYIRFIARTYIIYIYMIFIGDGKEYYASAFAMSILI